MADRRRDMARYLVDAASIIEWPRRLGKLLPHFFSGLRNIAKSSGPTHDLSLHQQTD